MSKKTLGIVLIVVGVVAVVVSLEADALGIGSRAGIGLRQALGAVVGVLIVAVGAWFWPGFPHSRLLGDGTGSPRSVPSGTSRSGAVRLTPTPRGVGGRERGSKPAPAKKPRAAKSSRSSRRSKRGRK